ncbi:uncharacterized protein LOC143074665 [Mytilus galloprovincialis]|uniref:uncharacterized protein LOC143074665 n=1 Tax=Mytilus galloprovincialis TaxID=29158 RepID=UPI003F7C8CB5
MNYFYLLTLVLFLECVGCALDENKRLLLNDPDAIARLANLEQQNQLLTQKVLDLESKMATRQDHGSTYVRWGRTQCEGTHTELVYSGYAAGQRYNHIDYSSRYGGPANTLCLPKDPELSNISFASSWSLLYGAEYQVNGFAHDSVNNDVPCAVCRNIHASSSIMIPGRLSCYSGWIEEYNGLLASGHQAETASSYVCVDMNPEYVPSGEKNENGLLFYVVGLKCGPLPCPPYHNNHQVNCVVCSK